MRSKKFALLTTTVLSLVILAACGNNNAANTANTSTNAASGTNQASNAEQDEAKQPSLEVSSLSIGTARDLQLASEIIVAIEEGYFSEEGLDIKLELFQSGADVTAALAGGSIPIGSVGDSPATILKGSGSSVQIIAQQSDISGAQSMVVNPNTIKTPEDLNGKKIAYSPGNTSEALFLQIVEHYGLDTSSMDIYKMGGTEMTIAYEKGDIDAFVVWEPVILNTTKIGAMRFISASQSYVPGEEGPQKLAGFHSVLLTDTKFAEKHPNTVKAVLRALSKAVAFIHESPDQAAAHAAETLQLDLADAIEIMSLNEYSLAITPELIEDIENTSSFLLANEKIKELPDFSEFVNPGFLLEVDPTLVTWTP